MSDPAEAEPFRTAEDCWFWFAAWLQARRDGARMHTGYADPPRPCAPADVWLALMRLLRRGALAERHARVMVVYGQDQAAPDRHRPERRLWDQAMAELGVELRRKGIVIERGEAPAGRA